MPKTMPKTVIIAAVASNMAIGHNGKIPWHVPDELKLFQSRTIGKPIVMGRKTFDSIGSPLKGRTNIVVTRNRDFFHPDVLIARSPSEGLQSGQNIATVSGVDEVMIIGGGELYAWAMPFADRLEISELCLEIEGDVFFPAISSDCWVESSRVHHDGLGAGPGFSFVIYERCPA